MKLFKIEYNTIEPCGIIYVVASSYDDAVAQCRRRILNVSVIADTNVHSGYDVLVLVDKVRDKLRKPPLKERDK